MENTKKNVKEFLLEDFLFTFVIVGILLSVVVYAPWVIYKAIAGLSTFLVQNLEIPLVMYAIAVYSAFVFPKMIKIRVWQIRLNTIITIVVSMVLLLICVPFWWVLPLLTLLITLTCIKNKYTGVEIEECYVTPTVEDKEE